MSNTRSEGSNTSTEGKLEELQTANPIERRKKEEAERKEKEPSQQQIPGGTRADVDPATLQSSVNNKVSENMIVHAGNDAVNVKSASTTSDRPAEEQMTATATTVAGGTLSNPSVAAPADKPEKGPKKSDNVEPSGEAQKPVDVNFWGTPVFEGDKDEKKKNPDRVTIKPADKPASTTTSAADKPTPVVDKPASTTTPAADKPASTVTPAADKPTPVDKPASTTTPVVDKPNDKPVPIANAMDGPTPAPSDKPASRRNCTNPECHNQDCGGFQCVYDIDPYNSSTKDKIQSGFHDAKGGIKESIGHLLHRTKLEAEGHAEKEQAKLQKEIAADKEVKEDTEGKDSKMEKKRLDKKDKKSKDKKKEPKEKKEKKEPKEKKEKKEPKEKKAKKEPKEKKEKKIVDEATKPIPTTTNRPEDKIGEQKVQELNNAQNANERPVPDDELTNREIKKLENKQPETFNAQKEKIAAKEEMTTQGITQ